MNIIIKNRKDEYVINEVVVGSAKQISWANKIKTDKIKFLFNRTYKINTHKVDAQTKKILLQHCDMLNAIVDSRYFIDNRDEHTLTLIKKLQQSK